MLSQTARFLARSSFATRRRVPVFCAALLLSAILTASAQEPTPAPQSAPPSAPATQPAPAQEQNPAPAPNQPAAAESPAQPALTPEQAPVPDAAQQTPPTSQPTPKSEPAQPGETTEEELKQMLVGKLLYLRGGYLDDSLSFNEHGILSGHSPQGSYTLSGVAIERVHLTKHKVELEGQRYGLHFLGALPSEDPTTAMDRVLITPKKKLLRISIDREVLVTPKKVKEKGGKPAPPSAANSAPAVAPSTPSTQPNEPSDADQAKAEIAAAPAAERPADPASVTTTTSPAHAAALLKDALDHVFSVGFDDRMMAAMPDFWKLYYQAVAAKSDYHPTDSAVLRQNAVDSKARLVSVFEPPSNEFAQSHGVAGLALYHVVIGADGKPGEIAVARPIGFGLDENAVDSIRKASFQAATKDGKPVPVLLDLIVEFHIYSGLTNNSSKTTTADKSAGPMLPGPYSVPHS
jgi:outer membrane biosynthesis protein TonB